jgi:hypothetical protein
VKQILQFLLYRNRKARIIGPGAHAVLDYVTAGYFFVLTGYYWGKHRRAAATALINGLEVLGLSVCTDYPGGLFRVIPFETHGKIDLLQAATAAGLPLLLGFAHEGEALPFELQCGNELMVVSLTDWESEGSAAQREWERWRRAS